MSASIKGFYISLCFMVILPGILFAEDDSRLMDKNLNAVESPDHITLTWSEDPKTTQTITWRSSLTVTVGEVQYREADSAADEWVTEKVIPEKFSAVAGDSPGSFNLFSITLKALKPGTRYIYKVGSEAARSSELSFSTEAKEVSSFEFIIFGDTQSGSNQNLDYAPWHKTATQAYARHPAAKFMVVMGDLTECGMSYAHWNNWFLAAKDVISRIPVMPIIGNHEGTGETPAANSETPLYYLKHFPLFQNGAKELKGQDYSYDYGNVHITVLNSEQVFGKAETAKSQLEWLEEDLASTNKTWKLVFFHRPPYYNKSSRTNETVKRAYCPIIEKYNIDIAFNGHDHGLARTYPIKGDRLFSSPKDGTVYYTTGRSGRAAYFDLTKKYWNSFFFDPQENPCYETVRAGETTLTVTAFTANGELIDEYTIDKRNNEKDAVASKPERYRSIRFAVHGYVPMGPGSGGVGTARKIDGKWYVTASVFMGSIGGAAFLHSQSLELFYNGAHLKVPAEEVVMIKDGTLACVSVDVIKQFTGYHYGYDDSLNLLTFIK